MNARLSCGLVLLALIVAACAGRDRAEAARTEGTRLFMPIHQVLVHPRCVNCHVADGIPRQYDDHRRHGQNVHGGLHGKGVPGLACSSCHGDRNAPAAAGPEAPPGAPNWHLAPAEMVWFQRPADDICRRLRDPAHNGGKNAAALRAHFADDPLVAWGWQPGGQRTLPPLSHAQTVAAVDAWIAAGMPCP